MEKNLFLREFEKCLQSESDRRVARQTIQTFWRDFALVLKKFFVMEIFNHAHYATVGHRLDQMFSFRSHFNTLRHRFNIRQTDLSLLLASKTVLSSRKAMFETIPKAPLVHDARPPAGQIQVIFGPMFSGKT